MAKIELHKEPPPLEDSDTDMEDFDYTVGCLFRQHGD
jgi:hypothetical protein